MTTHTIHNFAASAEKIGTRHRGDARSKIAAVFDEVHTQIGQSIGEAEAKVAAGGSAADVLKVFKDNHTEAGKHRDAVLAHLAD